MTISGHEILLYAGAILLLFLTPGPVWVAPAARARVNRVAGGILMLVGVAIPFT